MPKIPLTRSLFFTETGLSIYPLEMASLKRPLDEAADTANGSETTEHENGANGENDTQKTEEVVQATPTAAGDDSTFFSSKKRKSGVTMEEYAKRRFGLALSKPDFTNEDQKYPPWNNTSRKLYREKKTLHDSKKASDWMRWWFKEHDGLPDSPTRPLQSAFILWQQEKMAEDGTTMKDKKERKRLGAEWKSMTEEEQAPWQDKLALIREDFDKEDAEYEEKLEAWREDKLARVTKRGERSDGEKDCTCIYCIGEDSSIQGRGRT